MTGIRLMLLHPELPSCADCQKWVYDKNWQPQLKRGSATEFAERPPGSTLPCRGCPKIAKGEKPCPATGEKAELSDKNWLAWIHYVQCKAVMRFPVDDIVERNAGLIRMVEDQVARSDTRTAAMEPVAAAMGVMTALGGKRR